MGSDRNIGFFGAFAVSLLLSPLVGGIITLTSESKAAAKHKEQVLKVQEEQAQALRNMEAQKATPVTTADELLKLKSLLDAGAITQLEYEAQKAKLLA